MTDELKPFEVICPYCQCGIEWLQIFARIKLPINDGDIQGIPCPVCEKDLNVICWKPIRFTLDND